jgi:two-component system OmpR family response regulator
LSGRILVVEDDVDTADYVAKGLREAGFTVEHVADGRDGLYLASSSAFDAIVMDRMLPGMDGLSALGQLDERVIGLRAGGDDYLTKPFGFSELHARIENLLRRRGGKATETVLRCADLEMDLLSRKVSRAGRPLDLLPREFKLLEYFLRNCDRVVTRTMLLEQVWDYRFDPHTSTPISVGCAKSLTTAFPAPCSIPFAASATGCRKRPDPRPSAGGGMISGDPNL